MKPSNSIMKLLGAFRVLVLMGLLFSQPGWMASRASAATVLCRVDSEATGANNGTTWANAFTDLQSALGASACTEIWVAAGTYWPEAGANRAATFRLKINVALYGGFSGSETDRDQRDPATNLTILSGDIDHNDSQKPVITDLATVTGTTTNSYHVVSGATGATVDGFTVTAGSATGNAPDNFGAGMFNDASSPAVANVTFSGNYAMVCGGGMVNLSDSNPTLTGVTFSGNNAAPGYASGLGGGMYDEDSSPVLVNVTFTGNATKGASGRGGGMYNYSGSPSLTNVTFNGNQASNNGGGLYNQASNIALVNVTFSDNSASRNGGGMYNGSGSPTLTNVTFSNNSAVAYGGGMWNSSGSPLLTNVTFSGNTVGSWGGGMYNSDESASQIRNTIFWGNSADGGGSQIAGGNHTSSVSDSVVQAGCPSGSVCTEIIISDPRLGTLGDFGGLTHTIPLQAGSSAIDAGNDATCATTDQRGLTRPQGAHCDIGAFEYFRPTLSGHAGAAFATMLYTGGSTTADGSGNYTFSVPYGWSGTLTPSRTGYTFSPVSRSYSNVTADQTAQDYTATLNTYTISGDAGVAGATIIYLGGSMTTAESGNYMFTVSHGWTGTVTPSKAGYTFSPSKRTYTDVQANMTAQDYTAIAIVHLIYLPLSIR